MKGRGELKWLAYICSMSLLTNRTVKYVVSAIAILNILVMMLFQYGLPSPVELADGNVPTASARAEQEDVGTIEAIEQETAAKEAEAVETALAKEESEEPEEEEEERDPDAPILELTDDHIYLHVGDRFNYMSYIKTMEDVDGSDLSHYIYLDKDVDTDEPGETELTYRITSTITGKSDSKVLLITVEE